MSKLFRRDTAGIEELLKSPKFRAIVEDATAKLAAATNAQLQALPSGDWWEARGKVITTDRAHGFVVVPAYLQASHGVLTRAASSVGIEVHTKKGRS